MDFTILSFEKIDSTNTEAIKQAKQGADEGLCIIADEQTQGRGRYGRTWISPKNSGLYFSFILRPKIEIRFLPLITLMSAVAVHDAIEETYKIDCDIKWVNDIHTNEKKICGILAETTETKHGLAVIVGIGINLTSANFPPEVAETATSIEAETGLKPSKTELLPALTSHLEKFCSMLYRNPAQIRHEWSKRSSYAFDKKIKVILENKILEGLTCGIEENGALRLRLYGEIKIINAGEVERLRAEINLPDSLNLLYCLRVLD